FPTPSPPLPSTLSLHDALPISLALFLYAAGFSFAYVDVAAGTGALLLFGAVQATMILWGLHKGERLRAIQIVGLVVAMTGLVVRSEEHTSELQSLAYLVCRLLL